MPPKPLRFLTASQVQRLYNTFILAAASPTQPSLLDSAIQSPININHYNNQNDVFALAGELSVKIMKNHAFQDGNKRTALVAADMLLRINGYRLQRKVDETERTRIQDAQVKAVTDVWSAEDLGKFYKSIVAPVDG
jgi:death-on-curing family protein